MRDKPFGTAPAYQLSYKYESLMFSHKADLCQVMEKFDEELKYRHHAKRLMNTYWKLENKRKAALLKLEKALSNIEQSLF